MLVALGGQQLSWKDNLNEIYSDLSQSVSQKPAVKVVLKARYLQMKVLWEKRELIVNAAYWDAPLSGLPPQN